MVVKNRKLHKQFDAEASNSSHSGSTSEKPIFKGVSIFVDGFTIPSSQELRSYMLKLGGRFENYFSRHRVTHIICSNLPDSKIKNLRSFSGGLPVVKPAWVVDSVSANKLLSWFPYQLDQLANEITNQPKLSAFFPTRSKSLKKDSTTGPFCQANLEAEDSASKDCKVACKVDEFVECMGQSNVKFNDLMQENANEEINKETSCSSRKSSDPKKSQPRAVDTEDDMNVEVEIQSGSCQVSGSATSYCLEGQHSNKLTKPVDSSPNPRHSTLGNPNFVENYFKNSRLHFIGTWRSRYRKRFASLSNRQKDMCSNRNASASQKTAIIHVDMDCFFVSVVIRNRPDLQDKAVAVCHSDNPRGTAEISSANYPARAYGVKAGIFVREAKSLCPHLVILPYNFEAYEEVADQFYDILHKHCSKVQAVSCDEAFLDVTDTDLEKKDPELLASTIRREIYNATGCTASAGVAGNMLMARLATRTAKPDGLCYIPPEKVDDYLSKLPIKALPGIGHVLQEKLKGRQIETCGQLHLISKESLQKDFGVKTGDMLWNYSRGIDNRMVGVFQESKSLGAEVNWGVRFNNMDDCQQFMLHLCKEVGLRLQGCGVQGRTFTLKIKKRRKNAEEPSKYMGCGDCENLSHSTTVPLPTDDVDVLQRIARQLFGSFHVDVREIRGIGLQVSKLENADIGKQGPGKNPLQSWLASASSSGRQCKINDLPIEKENIDCEEPNIDGKYRKHCGDSIGQLIHRGSSLSAGNAGSSPASILPPLGHLDMGVVESLPPELFFEINEVYGGKLTDLVAKNKSKKDKMSSSMCANGPNKVEGEIDDGIMHRSQFNPSSWRLKGKQARQNVIISSTSSTISDMANPDLKVDMMPSSLSQVDISVLQQLPEELRVDILELLPAHRKADVSPNAAVASLSKCPQELSDIKSNVDCTGSVDLVQTSDLWNGNPPQWVFKFKDSKCLILSFLAEKYYRLGSTSNFSSILQSTISKSQVLLSANFVDSESQEAMFILCELLKQYIKLKLESDIEEIHVCFRLLRRLKMKSLFFSQVYSMVFPYLQASVNDHYGGNLHISHDGE